MSELVILVSSLSALTAAGVEHVFSDRHAYLVTAQFRADPVDLATVLPWDRLQARNFERRTEDDVEAFERYQAEALAYRHVPLAGLSGIVCHSEVQQTHVHQMMQNAGSQIAVQSRPEWFF